MVQLFKKVLKVKEDFNMRHKGPSILKESLYRADLLNNNNNIMHNKRTPNNLNAKNYSVKNSHAGKNIKLIEEKFSPLMRYSSDIITVLNHEGLIAYQSPSVRQVLGYLQEELIGRNAFDLIHPEDVKIVEAVFNKCVSNPGIPHKVEFRYKKADNTYLYLESVGTNYIDDPAVKGIVINSRDVTGHKEYEHMLKAALEEKEMMLSEIEHRVKNNLQVVSSLLRLQAEHENNEVLKKYLLAVYNRVNSMSLIFKLVYKSDDLGHINIEEFLYTIVSRLFVVYKRDREEITVKIHAKNIVFNLETSVPLAIIINEMLVNSLRQNLSGSKLASIKISLYKHEDENYSLKYNDSRIGFPVHILNGQFSAFSMNLIDILVKQLEGNISTVHSKGLTYNVDFRRINCPTRFSKMIVN